MCKVKSFSLLSIILVIFSSYGITQADVLVYALDTSGSMKNHGFEDAKQALIKQIKQAVPGDVIYTISFDTNDHLLGRVAVGENGNLEDKKALIEKVIKLKAKGLHTNLDEPLQAAKALLLEERSPGDRKIVILSDGLSDPGPGHEIVNLETIAQIIPQHLGWNVYLVGLPADLTGLFQQDLTGKEFVVKTQNPHIKGIPLREFSREKIEEAVEIVKKDKESPARGNAPIWLWLVGTVLLVIGSVVYLLSDKKRKYINLVLEVTGEDSKVSHSLVIKEGERKTVGSKGDVLLELKDIPPVVFILQLKKGLLWLTPLDAITLNGRPVTQKTPINIGDLLSVREAIQIIINEGGDEEHVEK